MPKNNEVINQPAVAVDFVEEWLKLVLQNRLLDSVEQLYVMDNAPEKALEARRVNFIGEQVTELLKIIETIDTRSQVAIGLHGRVLQALLDITQVLIAEGRISAQSIYSVVAPAIIYIGQKLQTTHRTMPLAPLDTVMRKAGASISPIYTTTG